MSGYRHPYARAQVVQLGVEWREEILTKQIQSVNILEVDTDERVGENLMHVYLGAILANPKQNRAFLQGILQSKEARDLLLDCILGKVRPTPGATQVRMPKVDEAVKRLLAAA